MKQIILRASLFLFLFLGGISINIVQAETFPVAPAESKWDLWNGGPRLRGANLHPCRISEQEKCIEPITRKDLQELRTLNANVINASYPGVFNVLPPYELNEEALSSLDTLVQWAEEIDIFVVISLRTGPGRNEAAIHLADDGNYDVWQVKEARDAWSKQWQFIAKRYKNSPVVIGYNIFMEPHPNTLVDPYYELEPVVLQKRLEGTSRDWNIFAAEITSAIRAVDGETPIIIESIGWAAADFFPVLRPVDDPYSVYGVHFYEPDIYTHQLSNEITINYPETVYQDGEKIYFNRTWLEMKIEPVVAFADRYDVPIFVGEYGTMRWVPGSDEYLSDLMGLFENHGWNFSYYVWRGDELYFDGFNVEYGPHVDLNTYVEYWNKNIDFPSTLKQRVHNTPP